MYLLNENNEEQRCLNCLIQYAGSGKSSGPGSARDQSWPASAGAAAVTS